MTPPTFQQALPESTMKSFARLLTLCAAAGLLTLTLGCEPPKPPAPETDDAAETSTASNTSDNTTADGGAPAGETP
ncbi:MAG: hypothetical protein AAF802_24420 [Planctomycetota bacterium]